MMPKATYHTHLFRFSGASLLILALLNSSHLSFAQEPTAAVITTVRGNQLLIRRGTKRATESVKLRESVLRRKRDTLFVPGDNDSKAGLNFKTGEQEVWGGMLVETIPRNSKSEYEFPCSATGSMTIAWAKGGKKSGKWRACNEGVYVKAPSKNPSQKKRTQATTEQADNKALVSQDTNLDELLIQPGQDHTVIQILSTDDSAEVLVLLGEVGITTPTGSSVNLQTGQKYSYPSQQVSPFDRNPITQSEDFKKFLDPDSWSSPSSPSQALQTDLEEKQVALGLKNPPSLSPIAQEILDAHNQCRGKVGVPPLRWSTQIAAKAQEWADHLSGTGEFEHRSGGGSGYGENLAAGGMSPTDLVKMWCNEQNNYDPQTGKCLGNDPSSCYHFTQVVWRDTSELGCGLASHPQWGKVLVCNYNPPGNYNGQRPY